MLRLFKTHEVRPCTELEGLWDFTMEGNEKQYRMMVPGCIEQHPDFLDKRGIGCYTRKIEVAQDGNLRFEFKGVSHTADVYIDNEKLVHHYNAFTPFSAIAKNVQAGVHELKVYVDNRFTPESALHVPNDYYTYGGITRPVAVEQLKDVYIKNVQFEPIYQEMGGWKARIRIILSNISKEKHSVSLRAVLAPDCLYEEDGTRMNFLDKKMGEAQNVKELSCCKTIAAEEELVFETEAFFDGIQPWSSKYPNLYLFKLILSMSGRPEDDYIDRVGFREVRIEGKDILVNGEKIYLKGFNRHEDYATVGCAIPFQLMVQDMDLMQEMNANAVRTCHYPNDERFLDLCDERGMYVWEENHARGFGLERMQNPNFDVQCRDCIDEMIGNHFNHPSIIIWGILNECASETEEGREKYARQYAQIRSLDSSRPTTSATCRHLKDICLDLPDIVSFNMYSGWYKDVSIEETNERELDWIQKSGGNGKPVIVSEFGAAAIYGFRDRSHCKWSEERQADIIRENLEVYMKNEAICGVFVWQFVDCRVTEEEWFSTRARCHNNKGVVDEYRRPKFAFDTVKEMFQSK